MQYSIVYHNILQFFGVGVAGSCSIGEPRKGLIAASMKGMASTSFGGTPKAQGWARRAAANRRLWSSMGRRSSLINTPAATSRPQSAETSYILYTIVCYIISSHFNNSTYII